MVSRRNAVAVLVKLALGSQTPQTQTQTLTPPPSSRGLIPHDVPLPRPAAPVRRTVPAAGFSVRGYGGATPVSAQAAAPGAAAANMRGRPPAQSGQSADAAAVQSSGDYAARAVNYLANLPEFQRRVGGGKPAVGRRLLASVMQDMHDVPVVNEATGRGVAMAYTRDGDGSRIALPASTISAHRTYRGAGGWLDGTLSHEMFHPFTIKTPGYVDRIKAIQDEEHIPDPSSYYHSPREQAAELNAVRAIKGAWPGGGAGDGGRYTPEQADAILDNMNPYFNGLPVQYKMRLLNEARNTRTVRPGWPARSGWPVPGGAGRTGRYGVARRTVI